MIADFELKDIELHYNPEGIGHQHLLIKILNNVLL